MSLACVTQCKPLSNECGEKRKKKMQVLSNYLSTKKLQFLQGQITHKKFDRQW